MNYGFDSQGRITSLSVAGAALLSGVEYVPFGPPAKWTWSNGQVMERVFDQDGRIRTLTLGPSTASYADLLQGFGYDGVNRLITADLAAGQSQTYTYDGVGNRLSFAVAGATTTYSYPANSHRLASLSGATTRSFTYDAAGSVTASAGITYVYDDRGRLKQAGATTYAVNGLGQRVRKANAAGEVLFAYDEAGRLLGEYDAAGNVIQETVWFGDLPVAVIKASGTLYYIWADHLGTPRIISDASNQIRWDWQQRDPFGDHAPEEDPSGVGVFEYHLRFPGQYFDAETGLHYNYFRDYDPSIGRYVQSDPIGLQGGINTFSYVDGDPLSRVDPTGEFANVVIGGASGAILGFAIAKLTGDVCYGWQEALEDAALGAVGAGLISKLNKLSRISKLRSLAESRGLQEAGRKGYVETWKGGPNAMEKLEIKHLGGKSSNLQAASKVPRFSYRTESGTFWDPFTGAVGPKGALSHVPLEPTIPWISGGVGATSALAARSICECKE